MRQYIALIALLLVLSVSAVTDTEITGNMDASNNIPSFIVAKDSPALINITFQIRNLDQSEMRLFLAQREADGWLEVQEIGTIAPNSGVELNLSLPVTYAGQTETRTVYALIGKTRHGTWLHRFNVNVQWNDFEEGLLNTLTVFSITLVPVALIALVVVAVLIFILAYKKRHAEVEEGEYSLFTLIFPFRLSRPIKENIADLIVNVFFWLIALGVLGLFALFILLSTLGSFGGLGLWLFIVAGVLAIAPPTIYAFLAWASDVYEREPLRFLVSMFAWGIFSLLISFIGNTLVSLILGSVVGPELTIVITAVMVAPVVEELSKGFGVLIASGHHEMNNVFDGMLYGFVVGLGFAAGENWLYFASNASPAVVGIGGWGWLMFQRSALTAVGHGLFTGTTGLFLGLGKHYKVPFAGVAFIPGVILAIGLHATFNFFALVDGLINFYGLFPF
ncbi:PrsW family intramembrane metalloprotease, partial [Candidatus Micrarchaeota archaeon]|nr:PrsW family intramembrane metalloprotease [Candidatus Micrarchaeota archaeon]